MTITTEIAVEPTTHAIDQLAEIVAGHAAFQEAVKKYHKDEARAHVYPSYYRVAEQRVDAPFAVIFESAGVRWDRRSDTTVLPFGELFLHLGLLMDSDDAVLEERRFNNWHGSIAQAISSYNGPGYRMLTTVSDPPARTAPQNQAVPPLWEVGYNVSWGPL